MTGSLRFSFSASSRLRARSFSRRPSLGLKPVGLEDEGVEMFVKCVELASGCVEVGAVEFGDAPLLLCPLLAAVVVELGGLVANDLEKELGQGE